MTTAVVFDYGFGNVRSMVRALANLGVDTTLTSDYRQSLEADGLVVPGVGAFAACMEGLKKVDGDRVIYDRIRAGRPVLGVCVGEQIGGHFTGSLVRHVMESIAFHAGICLHMQVLAGRDPHHIAEAEFKALARALRFAVEIDPRVDGVPSTKGAL